MADAKSDLYEAPPAAKQRAEAIRRADLRYVPPPERETAELERVLTEPPMDSRWFAPLSPVEKALQGVFLGLGAADWGQTVNFTQNPALRSRMYEVNPLLGRNPSRAKVNTLIPLGLAAHTLGVHALPRPWRNILQMAGLGGETWAVVNNARGGISPVVPWKRWK